MKFALTITEASASELAQLLSTLGGSTAITIQPAPTPQQAGNTDDDDNGPADPNAPAIDKDGLPWDERIHSSNKQMTDKGVWRKRRGVSDATVKQVEAELRARVPQQPAMQPAPVPMPQQPAAPVATIPMPAPAMPATPPVPMPQPNGYPTGPGYPQQPTNVVVTAPQPEHFTVPASISGVPGGVQLSVPAAPAPQPAAAPTMDFPTFMQALSGQMQKRDAAGMPLIDTDYLSRLTSEVSTAFGTPLGVITDMVSQPRAAEMIVYAVQCLTRDGKWN